MSEPPAGTDSLRVLLVDDEELARARLKTLLGDCLAPRAVVQGEAASAVQAMELGLDGVLLNSAVAHAIDPVRMARAFGLGIASGRMAFEAGVMPKQDMAVASTPVAGYPILL